MSQNDAQWRYVQHLHEQDQACEIVSRLSLTYCTYAMIVSNRFCQDLEIKICPLRGCATYSIMLSEGYGARYD